MLCHSQDEYTEFITKDCKNLVDVLEHFPSVALTLDLLFEYTPKVQPRYYTIASSSIVHPGRVSIALSVTRETLPDGREFFGLASGFLRELRPGKDKVQV
jgi:NADPH-ferrihemoprotein reductase